MFHKFSIAACAAFATFGAAMAGERQAPTLHSLSRRDTLRAFAGDTSGATAIEYALLASLMALALVTVVGALGTRMSGVFSEVSAALK